MTPTRELETRQRGLRWACLPLGANPGVPVHHSLDLVPSLRGGPRSDACFPIMETMLILLAGPSLSKFGVPGYVSAWGHPGAKDGEGLWGPS